MKTTVYRVEDCDGGGPYRRNHRSRHKAIAGMAEQHCDHVEHPTPSNDVPGAPHGWLWDWDAYLCGFASVADALQWFHGWLAGLHQAGFRLSTYEVDSRWVERGSRQVLFIGESAKRVKQTSLIEAVMAG